MPAACRSWLVLSEPVEPGRPGTRLVLPLNLRASLSTVLASRKPHTMALQRYDIRCPGGTFEERW